MDVGYGQLAWKLRQDKRVIALERTNIRYMTAESLPGLVDLVTIDVSFISLKVVVPEALKFIKDAGVIIGLIKPQFEVGRGQVGKGGIVRDPELHNQVNRAIFKFCTEAGLVPEPVVPSPILGAKGNKEFIIACHNK